MLIMDSHTRRVISKFLKVFRVRAYGHVGVFSDIVIKGTELNIESFKC